MSLTGGHLLDDLARCGMVPTEITDVILTHLHADHIGWLFDRSAVAVFPAATLWFGQGDWSHFVTGAGEMADHIRAGVLATPLPRADACSGASLQIQPPVVPVRISLASSQAK